MERPDIGEIVIAKLTDRELSQAQQALFEAWISDPANEAAYQTLLRQQAAAFAGKAAGVDVPAAWAHVKHVTIGEGYSPAGDPAAFNAAARSRKQPLRHLLRYVAAVGIVAAAGAAAYIFTLDKDTRLTQQQEVLPGQFKAILTVEGRQTLLSDRDTIALGENGEPIFTNTREGLQYTADAVASSDHPAYNTLAIPRGGYYKVLLSDGTVVWLNSETSLRFPSTFPGDTRTVEVDGEAYFNVAPDKTKPFIVLTGDYSIRVTGTRFNVRNYQGAASATTLVDGAVQIEYGGKVATLRPGQQAIVTDGQLSVKEVDTEGASAWIQGSFVFRLERLEDIMAELARWYDIEVVWDYPADKDIRFSAWFGRDSDIAEIIDILQKTHRVSLSLSDRTLTVSRYRNTPSE